MCPVHAYHGSRWISSLQRLQRVCPDRKVHPFVFNSCQRFKHSASSKNWINRQGRDPYARRAREEHLPSRSFFKLEQMDSKHKLFRTGQVIIDLGACPGGWSVYAARQIGKEGFLVSVDLLNIDQKTSSSLARMCHFSFHKGDFTSSDVKFDIMNSLNNCTHDNASNEHTDRTIMQADVVMSDMAMNFCGDQLTDALRTISLCEDALDFAANPNRTNEESLSPEDCLLREDGTFLCKFFSCGQKHEQDLMTAAKYYFSKVRVIKPLASRKDSSEKYLLAMKFKGLV